MLHIKNAVYISNYSIFVEFSDGKKSTVDLSDELWGPVFLPLQELEFFKQFEVHKTFKTLSWPNGADFAPEFLYSL